MHTYRLSPKIRLSLYLLAVAFVGGLTYFHFHRTHATGSVPTVQTQKPPSSVSKRQASAQLQTAVDSWVAQQPFRTAITISELTGSERTASHNDTTVMVTASTYKLFVAYAVLHDIEQGKINLGTHVRTGQTVSDALNKMIVQSDNTSAEALGFLIGWDTVNAYAAAIGATHTDINNYDGAGNPTQGDKQSTTADLNLLLVKLQTEKLLNQTNTRLLLNLMKQQVWRERIPNGVPDSIPVADKPGWLSYIQNDAAIVYGPKSTYILVVMTTSNETGPLADLSRVVYSQLEM